jgi:hypothetical protein
MDVHIATRSCHIDHYLSFDIAADKLEKTLCVPNFLPLPLITDKLRIYSSNQKLLEAHIDPNDGTLQLKTSASDLGCHKFDVFMFSDRY